MNGAKCSVRFLSVMIVIIMLLCNISVIGMIGQSVDSTEEGPSNMDYDVVATNVDEAIYEPIYGENGECIEYKLVRGVNGNFAIPDTYEGKPVTVIGPRAFYHFENLGPITIGSNVREICDEAFAYSSIPGFHRQSDNPITFGERVFAESDIRSISLLSNDSVITERDGSLYFNLLLNTRNLVTILVKGSDGPILNPIYDGIAQNNMLCYKFEGGAEAVLHIAASTTSISFNSSALCDEIFSIDDKIFFIEGLFNWCTEISDIRVDPDNLNLHLESNGDLLVNNNRLLFIKPVSVSQTIVLPDNLNYNFLESSSNPFAWVGSNRTFVSDSDKLVFSDDGKELMFVESTYVVPGNAQFSVVYHGDVLATFNGVEFNSTDSGIIFDSEKKSLSITGNNPVTVLVLKEGVVEELVPSSVNYDLTGADTIEIVKMNEYRVIRDSSGSYTFDPSYDDPKGTITINGNMLNRPASVDSFLIFYGQEYKEVTDSTVDISKYDDFIIFTKTHIHFEKNNGGDPLYLKKDGSLSVGLTYSGGSVFFSPLDGEDYYVSITTAINGSEVDVPFDGDFNITFDYKTTPESFESLTEEKKNQLKKMNPDPWGILYEKVNDKWVIYDDYLEFVSSVFVNVKDGDVGHSILQNVDCSNGITKDTLDSIIANYSETPGFESIEASYSGTPEQVPCEYHFFGYYNSSKDYLADPEQIVSYNNGVLTVPSIFIGKATICGEVYWSASLDLSDASSFIVVEDLDVINNINPSDVVDVPHDDTVITIINDGTDYSFSQNRPGVYAVVVYVSGTIDPVSQSISYEVKRNIDGIKVDYNHYVFATIELDTLTLPVMESMDQWGVIHFTYADNVDTLVIPEGTKYFGSNILDAGSLYSMKVKNIILPSSITHFNADTIQDFNELRQVIIDDSCSDFFTVDGCVYGHIEGADSWKLLMVPNSKAGCFIIPNEVSYIAPSAFSGTSVKTVYIGSNMERIGLYAFEDCYNLETVVIPNNVRYIMGNAFSGCVGLKTVVMGDGLCQLHDEAFNGCLSLKNVIIGNLNPETIDVGKPGYVYGYWAAGFADAGKNNQKGYEALYEEYGPRDENSVMMKALRVGNNVFPEGVTVKFANGQTWAHVDYKSVNTTDLTWNGSYVPTDSDYDSKGVIFSLTPVTNFQSAEEMDFHWVDNGNDVWNSLSEYYVLVNDSTERMVIGAVSGNGSITTDGTKYYFEPMSGWALSNVIIDGVPMGTMESFTPDLKDRDITIHAIFVEKRGYTPINEIKDYLQKSKYGIQFSADLSQILEESVVLDNDIFKDLMVDNKTLSYSIYEGINCKYVWTFDGMGSMNEFFLENSDYVHLDMKIDEGEVTVNDVEKAIPLNFSASGQLPYESTIRYYVGDEFADGSTVQVSYVDGNGDRSETQSLQVENGYIHMRISHCSNYVITGSPDEVLDGPVMSLDCNTGHVLTGESVSFSVHLTANDVSGFAVTLSYNSSIFEFESYETIDGAAIESMENNRFVMALNNPTNLDSVVLTFKLKALSTVQDTVVSAELRFSEDNILGTSSVSLDVVDYPRGDLTGDRLVTSDDAIYLLYRFMYGDSEYPLNQNPDFNGDGIFTTNDVIYLLYHSMFPQSEDYPLH